MKRLTVLFLIFLIHCTSNAKKESDILPAEKRTDTTSILHQYWMLEDADHPLGRDITQKEGEKDFMPGIVFINDGGILENPGGESYRGAFSRNGDVINVKYDDGTSGTYTIKKLNTDTLFVDRDLDGDVSQLLYRSTNTWWPDADENPFSKKNFAWTIKPTQSETEDQVRNRCRECVRFYQYYIAGSVRGDATVISFVGLPNCFNWYSGGIGLQPEKKLNKKWMDCFYDSTQALQGYAIMRHAILKKYNWDEKETNWMKQTVPVLQQMRNSL